MQVYTKILIGMAVGALIGATLGPKSPILPHDSYIVDDASRLELRLQVADVTSEIDLPEGYAVALERLEVQPSVAGWVPVQLSVDEQLVLRDGDGDLRQAMGVALHDSVTLWLRPARLETVDGGTAVWPEPVSAAGATIISALKPLGTLFMRLIKMVIVPLVFTSLLVGVASLGDVRRLGRMGGLTMGLYLGTTAVAISIGLLVAQMAGPGYLVDSESRAALQAKFEGAADARVQGAITKPAMSEVFIDMVPKNPIEAMAHGNMLQIIFFAVALGVALTHAGGSAVTLEVFDKIQQAMIVLIQWIMQLAPFGVAGLLAEVVASSGLSVLKALLAYTIVACVGLAIHTLVVYGGIARFGVGINLRTFLRAVRPAQLIAFSTSSSAAALPVTMRCAEERLGVSKSVSSFVLPLGATVNMDGTALYQGVAAMFVAQVWGMDLTLVQQLSVVLTATLASVGTASVPGAGMVNLAMVLTAIGIPAEGIALIVGADRIIDMFRTAVNATGDLAVAALVAKTEGELSVPE